MGGAGAGDPPSKSGKMSTPCGLGGSASAAMGNAFEVLRGCESLARMGGGLSAFRMVGGLLGLHVLPPPGRSATTKFHYTPRAQLL